jgi:hypothetical protein
VYVSCAENLRAHEKRRHIVKAKRIAAALAASATLVALAVVLSAGEELSFASSNYYIFRLGGAGTDVASVRAAAQADGFSVIEYDGSSAIAYEGASLATAPIESLLAGPKVLLIDGSRFLLRVASEASTYAVRPSAGGLELVFSPGQNQDLDGVLSVLLELERLGVLSYDVDFAFEEFDKSALKGPEAPGGARIDSDLYWLTVAEDWYGFAAAKGLSLVGLRARVVAELLPGSTLPAEYSPYISSESASLVELLIPIDLLVSLSSTEGIGFVRPPYVPVIP